MIINIAQHDIFGQICFVTLVFGRNFEISTKTGRKKPKLATYLCSRVLNLNQKFQVMMIKPCRLERSINISLLYILYTSSFQYWVVYKQSVHCNNLMMSYCDVEKSLCILVHLHLKLDRFTCFQCGEEYDLLQMINYVQG